MSIPEHLFYTSDHEWVAIDGSRARVGITDYAQGELGDVVFVDLPRVGTSVAAGSTMGEVESSKSVSDLYAPLTGTVVAVNEALAGQPDALNSDPYGEGWICEIEVSDPAQTGSLLAPAAYRSLIEG